MKSLTARLVVAASTFVAACFALAYQESADALLNRAQVTYRNGAKHHALLLVNKAITLYPLHAPGYLLRGVMYERDRKHGLALTDYSEAIRLRPEQTHTYNRRGGVRFKSGRILDAIKDFNKAIELDPLQEPQHWQRGIAYYYAGLYEEGVRQFESHQKVNPNDVENAVWHYLCFAKLNNTTHTRRSILRVNGDYRIPMTQIYRLFLGEGTIGEVLEAARAGSPSPTALNQRLFYAHFYIGLYQETSGNSGAARKNISQAIGYQIDHYMWYVAQVHSRSMRVENRSH